MALDPAPLTWLESLSNNLIDSWEGLKKVFMDNFQGAIARVGIYRDFGRNRPKTVAGLCDMMHDWSEQEEKMRERFPRRNDNNPGRTIDNCTNKNQRDY
jgi:hypothetical protein